MTDSETEVHLPNEHADHGEDAQAPAAEETPSQSQELALVLPGKEPNDREFAPLAVMMRTYRAGMRKTQKDMAAEIGIPANVLSNIEAGRSIDFASCLTLMKWMVS